MGYEITQNRLSPEARNALLRALSRFTQSKSFNNDEPIEGLADDGQLNSYVQNPSDQEMLLTPGQGQNNEFKSMPWTQKENKGYSGNGAQQYYSKEPFSIPYNGGTVYVPGDTGDAIWMNDKRGKDI